MSYLDYLWGAVAFFGSPIMVLIYFTLLTVISICITLALADNFDHYGAPLWHPIVGGLISLFLIVNLIAYLTFLSENVPSPVSWG